MSVKKTYKTRVNWSGDAEKLLLVVWKEKQEDLRKSKKNSHVFKDMETEFKRNNIDNISAGEIKTKITNMSKKFR